MSESNITRISRDDARKLKGLTDRERIRREETAGIEPELDEDEFELDWASARVVIPEPKQMISLRLDPDILAFFKAEGRGYQTRINAVLRAYMEAQKR
ncbi:BrnA antitoxin family protein [Pararhodobacter sp.]|uniref:BrnA antitoxin family protein n=1 Tax=Pararhodobacter sp. TaxID=2127056 RepID=UPI002FE1085A